MSQPRLSIEKQLTLTNLWPVLHAVPAVLPLLTDDCDGRDQNRDEIQRCGEGVRSLIQPPATAMAQRY